MIIQHIIITACLVLAVAFVAKKVVAPFKKQGCVSDCGCASSDIKKEISRI